MGYWAGLDVGESETHVCVTDEDGQPCLATSCQSDPAVINNVLQRFSAGMALVGIEAGSGEHLTRKLRALGWRVAVFETRQVRRFVAIRTHKTDPIDARGIADLARLGRSVVSQVHVKSAEIQQIKSQIALRDSLVRQRVRANTLLLSMLVLHGGKRISTQSVSRFRAFVLEQLAAVEQHAGLTLNEEVLPLLELSEMLASHVASLTKKLEQLANKNVICGKLMEIPGVGPLCALTFYATVEEPHRFRRAARIGGYLGLVPMVSQSGNTSKKGRITKMGNKRARTLLVTAATCLLRTSTKPSALKAWGQELVDRIGMPKARVAVARKLAVIMIAIWKAETVFVPFPAQGSA